MFHPSIFLGGIASTCVADRYNSHYINVFMYVRYENTVSLSSIIIRPSPSQSLRDWRSVCVLAFAPGYLLLFRCSWRIYY